ncbi:DNA-binding transcriptional regulator, LysR family [[Clostridium] aminophilum]|uniref:DNA-binding transcriptional regulator, LysR family n=1 Tax=[Clostridium] aminophilum TaxID=1526 RepID=A0A1I0GMV9_9FIRM|nr:LysR family transcriptional regulator [[Clostridium] aminophilum]SET72340.1 DNA-binding transcriptional regulator, LysR family [[Clostridium] aminophilum]
MFDGKEYVYAVYKEKSFSKAAQKLYISQPALSTAIKKVEKKIGKPIFDRSTNPISLTPSGEIYIEAIEKLFSLEQNTVNQLNNLNGLIAGSLKLGGTNFYTSFILPRMLSDFSHTYPKIKIELVEGTTQQLVEKLLSEDLDLILDNTEFGDRNYQKYYYDSEHILLAVPRSMEINERLADYRLTQDEVRTGRNNEPDCPELPLEKMEDTPFVMLKDENNLYQRAMAMAQMHNFQPQIILKLDSVVSAFNMACSGIGAAFIPDGLAKHIAYDVPLYFYRLDEKLSLRRIHFVKKRNKYMTRAMEEFIRIAVGDEVYETVSSEETE